MSNFKKTVISGTIWSVFGQISSLSVILITNILLARLLSPKEFGQLGIVMFFVTIASVLSESGLSGALVRKNNATKEDYSTVFLTNLIFSIFCFLIIYFSAEFISNYYKDSALKNLLIVAGFVLIINAFQITQNAKLISEMRFKQKSIYRFVSVTVSSIIGIYYAYNGLGVWTLILIQLLISAINTILLWVFEGFCLNFIFSKKSFNELYSFGLNTTLASLLNTAFDNIYQLILAKYFSLSQTGFFYQAKKLQDVPGGVISMANQSVFFSSLTKLQDDKKAFSKAQNKIALYITILLGFIYSFIYFYAEIIIIVLFGEEWIGAIFYMQLLSIASFFYVLENLNRVTFKVFNQTQTILQVEYIKKATQAITICIGVYFASLKILIIGFILTNFIGYLISYFYSRKIIGSVGNYELFNLLKVAAVTVITVVISRVLSEELNLQSNFLLLFSPLFLLLYLFGLYIFKVIDLRQEIYTYYELYKK